MNYSISFCSKKKRRRKPRHSTATQLLKDKVVRGYGGCPWGWAILLQTVPVPLQPGRGRQGQLVGNVTIFLVCGESKLVSLKQEVIKGTDPGFHNRPSRPPWSALRERLSSKVRLTLFSFRTGSSWSFKHGISPFLFFKNFKCLCEVYTRVHVCMCVCIQMCMNACVCVCVFRCLWVCM